MLRNSSKASLDNDLIPIAAMYNGYNYYSPNGSATNSPVILLPYPYPYDPFFMAPNTEVPLSTTETDQTTNDGDDEEGGVENEKAENDDGGAKEDKQNAGEEINVSLILLLTIQGERVHSERFIVRTTVV